MAITLETLRVTGNKIIGFGKHKGKTYAQAYEMDPDYTRWIVARYHAPSASSDMRDLGHYYLSRSDLEKWVSLHKR